MPPIAIVTGASSGIGVEFAKCLARRGGRDLVLIARRLERLEALKSELESVWHAAGDRTRKVELMRCDLGNDEQREALCSHLSTIENIEFLVNNAGFGSYTPFAESEVARELEMLRVNCEAPLELCRAVLPKMIAQRAGRIINVCSTAAFLPVPYMATYTGTKGFLLNFTLALGAEVRTHGITVLAHCPGPTVSEFHAAAGLKQKLRHIPAMSTEQVAHEALTAVEAGRAILVNGLQNRLLVLASRLIPLQWTARAVERKLRSEMLRIAAERKSHLSL